VGPVGRRAPPRCSGDLGPAHEGEKVVRHAGPVSDGDRNRES
jgi:hypothetical protein